MADGLLTELLADLAAESSELDDLIADLDETGWDTPTPAPGWAVRHQVAHLAWTDRAALTSATDPDRFAAQLARAIGDPQGYVQAGADEGAALPAADLLARWRDGRRKLADTLPLLPRGVKLPWFGPPMSPASMVTGRLMETWAHGQDVADALGAVRVPTARLRHVAWIGVGARAFSFAANGLPAPRAEVRVELVAPDGSLWTFGPEDAPERVSGPALDFCLLVTQRRHRADLALRADGPGADRWLDVAQAFAGPPGAGRRPGQFADGRATA